MKIAQIKGEYDAIFSLGDLCLTSIQLKRHNLRPYSGPLDWLASPRLLSVSELFENQFIGFLEFENLRVLGYADANICVSDDAYHLVSNHDFSTATNTLDQLNSYPEVMEKYNRRIQRLLNALKTSKRILFVRTEGTLEEAAVLEEVLSNLVRHEFNILLINHSEVQGLVEKNWPLKRVCSIELPNTEIWQGNNALWDIVLSGIRLKQT